MWAPVADERTAEDKSGKKVDGEFAVLNRPEKVSPENVTFEQNTWNKLREWTLDYLGWGEESSKSRVQKLGNRFVKLRPK